MSAEPGADAEPPRVSAHGITKAFDGVLALDAVDIDLRAGEVHALLGENGAGKTTLSNILAGIYRADAGTVTVDGVPHAFRSPAQAIEAGIGMVHQHFRLVTTMSVAENVHLGWHDTPSVISRKLLAERTDRLMHEVGMRVDPTAEIWQLSVGEQQRVEILRMLARGARVLILDEPTAVLTGPEARDLFRVLRSLVAADHTIVFISHKLNEVLEVSDTITVLRAGRRVTTRATAGATARELSRLMTGEERDFSVGHADRRGATAVLQLDGVTARGARGLVALDGVDLALHGQEIIGVAGVSGNGQTELAEVVTGMRRVEAGRVVVNGVDLTNASPRRFAEAGVGHIPEDRLGMALVRSAPVRDNAVLRHHRKPELSGRFALRKGPITRFAEQLVASARVQTRSISAPVSYLSGGNQQRLIARREAMLAARVFIAAHPTRGLDVHSTQDVQRSLVERREAGCAVLLISDDLDEIMLLADRIVVMYEGRIVGGFARAEADRERIGLLMGGHTTPSGSDVPSEAAGEGADDAGGDAGSTR